MNRISNKVVVFGIDKMAHLVSNYFNEDSEYEIVAYTVDEKYMSKNTFLSRPVVRFESVTEFYPPSDFSMFIAIGYHDLNKTRENKFIEAKAKGYNLPNYVCSKNIVWNDIEIGENCFLMEGNIFQMNVKIHDNVFVGMGNKIGHDTVVEQNCFITGNIIAGGSCVIRKNSFIGMGSIIRDNRIVEENNIIGAGSLISNSTEKNSSYFPLPTEKSKVNASFLKSFLTY